jgi:hypothetical protein
MPRSQHPWFAERSRQSRWRESSRLSRRRFLFGLGIGCAGALVPAGLASLAQPPAARSTLAPAESVCGESAQRVLDMAATAEALAITLYYRAIVTPGGFFGRLRAEQQGYLRVALDEERAHYDYLVGRGAQPLAAAFSFPAGIFGFGGFPGFLAAMDTVENASIGLYLAAARRLGELGQSLLAEILEQILGVEAEHRVIGRELAQTAPPPPNDRCFEQATAACVAWAFEAFQPFMDSTAGSEGPFALPSGTEIAAAVDSSTCAPVPVATASGCQESAADILGAAATAEALGITFYYQGIQSGFFSQLSQPQQWYLQAALDEERNHLNFLESNGGAPAATTFFFPDAAFSDLAVFLSVLDALENLFIGAYLAAARRFADLGQPLLAEIAGQILGVECEHRVLGRIIARQPLPHDRCWQPAPYTCLSEASADLASFLQSRPGATRQGSLPPSAQIDAAVDRFGCAPVALAANPSFVRLPLLRR